MALLTRRPIWAKRHVPEPIVFPYHFIQARAKWKGTPAEGSRLQRWRFVREGWLRARVWWGIEIRGTGDHHARLYSRLEDGQVRRGFAVYRWEGRWAVIVITKRLCIRNDVPSPYAGVAGENAYMFLRP